MKTLDAREILFLLGECERELLKLRDSQRAQGLAETDSAADTRSTLRRVANELQRHGKRSLYASE